MSMHTFTVQIESVNPTKVKTSVRLKLNGANGDFFHGGLTAFIHPEQLKVTKDGEDSALAPLDIIEIEGNIRVVPNKVDDKWFTNCNLSVAKGSYPAITLLETNGGDSEKVGVIPQTKS